MLLLRGTFTIVFRIQRRLHASDLCGMHSWHRRYPYDRIIRGIHTALSAKTALLDTLSEAILDVGCPERRGEKFTSAQEHGAWALDTFLVNCACVTNARKPSANLYRRALYANEYQCNVSAARYTYKLIILPWSSTLAPGTEVLINSVFHKTFLL